MNSSIKLAEIKANARGRLLGHYSQVVFITLSYFIFILFLQACAEMFSRDTSVLAFTIGIIASFVISAINLKYKISMQGYFLRLASGKAPNQSNVFSNFIQDGGAKSGLALYIALFQQICYFPAYVVTFIFDSDNQLHYILLAAALLLALILCLIIDIRLMPAAYLVNDVADISSITSMLTALWLTKKNFFKILLLRLYFIPLYILGIFSCGIGLLYVYPYMLTAEASMYLSLCTLKETENVE